MATSTTPALKRALKGALAARAGLDGVLVSWGWPGSPGSTMLLLGDATGRQDTKAMRGPANRHVRKETYDLEVTAYVEKGGSNQQAATERAYELMAEVEDELRDDPTVGGVVQSAVVGGPISLEERADPKGQSRVAILTFHVAVQARLT